MRVFIILLLLGLCHPALAQKKLLPALASPLTGIALPPESKQDFRGLSLISARAMLDRVAQNAGSSIESNNVEVLELAGAKKAGFVIDSFYLRLKQAGWTVTPVEGEKNFAWLQKENQYILSYWSRTLGITDIYLGKTNTAPAIAGIVQPPTQPTEIQQTPPAPVQISEEPVAPPPPVQVSEEKPASPAAGGFTFNTTNFDDGWVSVIEDDKVVVSKGPVKVYIYFPLAWDDNSRPKGRDYFWDEQLSRSFRLLSKQYRDGGEYISAFQPPYVEGRAIENRTGKEVFIALYTGSGSGGMYPTLAIAPDEATIRKYFPKAEDRYESDLHAMRNYNKFAVGQTDITGYWVGGASTALNYYHAYSGNYMGMNAAVSSDEFWFKNDGTYRSTHKGATGMVGNMNTYQQEYKGKMKVSNWEVVLTQRFEGKTDTHYAYFEAVWGGRILHLQHKQYTAQWFHLIQRSD